MKKKDYYDGGKSKSEAQKQYEKDNFDKTGSKCGHA